MAFKTDQLAVHNGGDFINAIGEQKATVKDGNGRFVFRYEFAVEIDGAHKCNPSD